MEEAVLVAEDESGWDGPMPTVAITRDGEVLVHAVVAFPHGTLIDYMRHFDRVTGIWEEVEWADRKKYRLGTGVEVVGGPEVSAIAIEHLDQAIQAGHIPPEQVDLARAAAQRFMDIGYTIGPNNRSHTLFL